MFDEAAGHGYWTNSSRLRKNGVKSSFSSSATSFAGRLRQLAVLTSATWAQRGGDPGAYHGLLREIANADQIVDREAEDEHPAHASRAPVPSLSQQTDRFQPAKDLLDALAFLLAHQIAGMPRGARIDRARTVRGVLRHVRRHLQPAKVRDEVRRVIPLVGAHGDAPGAADAREHRAGRRALGDPRRRRQLPIDSEAMPVLHQP